MTTRYLLSFTLFLFFFSSCTYNPEVADVKYDKIPVTYPATKEEPVTDVYHDREVVDVYRWLEDDLAKDTE